jgi:hypothetical protein
VRVAGGDLPAAPDSIGPPGTLVDGTYKVCLDGTRKVARVTPAHGIAGADEAVATSLHTWSWFVTAQDGNVQQPCFEVAVRLAVPGKSIITRQASHGVQAELRQGPPPSPSAWVAREYAGQVLKTTYKVCVGEDGIVQTVHPIVGVPGADEMLGASLRGSSWSLVVPTTATAPYCFAAPLNLDFSDLGPARSSPELASPREPIRKVDHGVSIVIGMQPVNTPKLRFPSETMRTLHAQKFVALYRTCVGADGHVTSVEALTPVPGDDSQAVATLRSWRYAMSGPVTDPICTVTRFDF